MQALKILARCLDAQNEDLKMVLYWTDLLLAADVPDALLGAAIADAFDLPIGAVGVSLARRNRSGHADLASAPDGNPGSTHARCATRRISGWFDDLMISLKADTVREPITKIRALARNLEIAIITDVETPEHTDTQWRLVAPDGWSGIVTVDFNAFNRDAFVLMPEARALLDDHTPRSSVRHAS